MSVNEVALRIAPSSSTLSLVRPGVDTVHAELARSRDRPFSYEPVGGTRGELPPGWDHDQGRLLLGRGDQAWRSACLALREWRWFELSWVELVQPAPPIEAGRCVAFLSWQLGMWATNVCRVVYVVDEPDRYGFAYGTLDRHVVAGEEQFLVTREGNEVWGSIRKFSRPLHPLVRLAGPLGRIVQRRFTGEALRAMHRAVAGES